MKTIFQGRFIRLDEQVIEHRREFAYVEQSHEQINMTHAQKEWNYHTCIAFKMASNNKRPQKRKRPKNKSWNDKEVNAFVNVLTSNEDRDNPWALTLETMALKKSSNEAVFRKILAELKSRCPESTDFTIDQLRRKYKWLKQEWRKINNKIRSGSGLAAKDTNSPEWYSLLDPILTEAVDGMMTLSSKSTDIKSQEESQGESSQEETWSDTASSSSRVTPKSRRSSASIFGTDDEAWVDEDGSLNGEDENIVAAGDTVLRGKESTDVKASATSKSKKRAPKTQTAALFQMVKGMEEMSKLQEKKSDERLATMLKMEMKRDEMLLAFQKEQAAQNRQHELMLAQLLVHSGVQSHSSYHPTSSGIGNPSSFGYNGSQASGHPVCVSTIAGLGNDCSSSFDDDILKVYHKL